MIRSIEHEALSIINNSDPEDVKAIFDLLQGIVQGAKYHENGFVLTPQGEILEALIELLFFAGDPEEPPGIEEIIADIDTFIPVDAM